MGTITRRQAGDRERLCETLVNCGTVAYTRGDYAQGDRYSLEALKIARQIGYSHAVTVLLGNLGEIATDRGEYVQAATYLQEALEVARRMEHRDLISSTLDNLGRIAMEQGYHEQAEAYLQEALEIARQIGRHRLLCRPYSIRAWRADSSSSRGRACPRPGMVLFLQRDYKSVIIILQEIKARIAVQGSSFTY